VDEISLADLVLELKAINMSDSIPDDMLEQ
jgi:hypothetical protein